MPGFVKPNCELTVGEIAELTRAKLRDGDPADRLITNIAPLDAAGPRDITFLDKPKYADALATTRAGACLIVPRFTASVPRSGSRSWRHRILTRPSSRSLVSCSRGCCDRRRCS